MMNSNLASLPLGETRICDDCGERTVRVSFREQRFTYGNGSGAVELSARVPVWICEHCEHGYTDGDAEDFRHEAVCRHLGVLSPEQIRGIRKNHGMTQAEFASATGFGLASVKRWETGALIQNQSADRLLRLIAADPGIMTRLIAMEGQVIAPSAGSTFRTPFSAETRAAAKIFALRPTGT